MGGLWPMKTFCCEGVLVTKPLFTFICGHKNVPNCEWGQLLVQCPIVHRECKCTNNFIDCRDIPLKWKTTLLSKAQWAEFSAKTTCRIPISCLTRKKYLQQNNQKNALDTIKRRSHVVYFNGVPSFNVLWPLCHQFLWISTLWCLCRAATRARNQKKKTIWAIF